MASRVVRGEIVKSRLDCWIKLSSSLSRVSLEAELLFRNLISLCDDYGRFDGDAEIIAAHAYPRRRAISAETVDGWLAELAFADGDDGPIELYFVDGRRFVRLVNWEIHRGKSRRGSVSRWPQPPGAIARRASKINGERRAAAREDARRLEVQDERRLIEAERSSPHGPRVHASVLELWSRGGAMTAESGLSVATSKLELRAERDRLRSRILEVARLFGLGENKLARTRLAKLEAGLILEKELEAEDRKG